MSTAFSVLPASTTVPLDEAGHGSASFTVANQTGRQVRVRVEVARPGEPNPPEEWFTPPETPERELAADGAQQFTVMVDVPPRSPGGTYNFGLFAKSVQLPDEEWAQSPLVSFVVPEPEPEPEPEPKPEPPRPKGYVETAAGALLGGFAGGLGAGLISALAIFFAAGLPTSTTGDFWQDLGNLLGTIIVLAVIAVVITALGVWVGTAVGVLLFLRSRGFPEPGRTALPTAVILPVWATVLLFLLSQLSNLDLPEVVGLILALLVTAVIIVVPALAGRALFRFRTTGGL